MSHEPEALITLGLVSLLVFKETLGQSFYPHTSVISVSFLITSAMMATGFFSAQDAQTVSLKIIVHLQKPHNTSQHDALGCCDYCCIPVLSE